MQHSISDSDMETQFAEVVGAPTIRSGRVETVTRWAAVAFAIVYLGVLGHGLTCHALQYRVNAHPLMYFTVWDMFCGWSGWSFRTHVIAEGESGQFYDLTSTPWDEYHPYSDLGRHHYDSFGNHAGQIGMNCLRQTVHEPILQMFVVEETWSKKFNLPDRLWEQVHDEPRQSHHYFHINSVYHPDGTPLSRNPTFLEQHRTSWLAASLRGQTGPVPEQLAVATSFANYSVSR